MKSFDVLMTVLYKRHAELLVQRIEGDLVSASMMVEVNKIALNFWVETKRLYNTEEMTLEEYETIAEEILEFLEITKDD